MGKATYNSLFNLAAHLLGVGGGGGGVEIAGVGGRYTDSASYYLIITITIFIVVSGAVRGCEAINV